MDERAVKGQPGPTSPWPGAVVLACGLIGTVAQVLWIASDGGSTERWFLVATFLVVAASGLGMAVTSRRGRRPAP